MTVDDAESDGTCVSNASGLREAIHEQHFTAQA
jgi:hypothetical protein